MRLVRFMIAVFVAAVVLSLGSCWFFVLLPRTDTYSGLGGSIPLGTSVFTVEMPVAAEIREIESITLANLFHSDSRALNIQLEAPGGFSAGLSEYRGDGSQSFDGTYVFVEPDTPDAVNIFLPTGGDIYPATYWSTDNLDTFDGKDTRGTWLLVIDNVGSTGSLDSWTLELTYKEY